MGNSKDARQRGHALYAQYRRCGVCDSVGHGDIAGDIGDIHHGGFRFDKRENIYVCSECQSFEEDIFSEWLDEDEEINIEDD